MQLGRTALSLPPEAIYSLGMKTKYGKRVKF